MAKVVTVRLSDEDYRKIASVAKRERRPISTFMTLMVVKGIEKVTMSTGWKWIKSRRTSD